MTHPLAAWLAECWAPMGEVRVRAMFGGHGVSLDGLSVGLIDDEVLFLKVDAVSLPLFEAAGLEAFTYDKGGVPVAMGYRRAPEDAYDDADVMREWGEVALAAARRAKRPKRRAT